MGGGAARPSARAGGRVRAPPDAAPLPAPSGTPGKAHPDGFLLPEAGESQRGGTRGPLCSVARARAAVALNFLPRGSHPARKRGEV